MLYRFSILLLCFFLFSSNVPDSAVTIDPAVLNLKWNKAYADETIEKATLGLAWTLSFVGAVLPESPSGMTIETEIITIDPNALGFDKNALEKIKILHDKIRKSEEYKKTNAIDLGRYVTLLIGASEHYYALTGVPKNLSDITQNYTLLPEKGYVNHSNVSFQHRIIRFSEPNKLNQLLISAEIDSVSKAVIEFETIEIIPNGQLRFGIFDANGKRKNSASDSHSSAGKPAKCIWCHESTISPMFKEQQDFELHLTYKQLQDRLLQYNQYLTAQKIQFKDGVRFSELQQHTLSELLYISFMEPSAQRLSIEWNMPVEQVERLLADLPTHVYSEFPFLGNLYDRNAVESRAPFKGLSVSSNVRETSLTEVNHLN